MSHTPPKPPTIENDKKLIYNRVRISMGYDTEITDKAIDSLYIESAKEYKMLLKVYCKYSGHFDLDFELNWIEKMCIALSKKHVAHIRGKYITKDSPYGFELEFKMLFEDAMTEISFLRDLFSKA